MTASSTLFGSAKRKKRARFRAKDEIIIPLLESLDIQSPLRFYAVLMPCLYGPELRVLARKGVPRRNLFAIERDSALHAIQRQPKLPAHRHLAGIRTTPRPMDASSAIDYVYHLVDTEADFGKVNLAYFDFYGQPSYSHYLLLLKIFRLRLLAPKAVLLLTFGGSRGSPYAARINARLQAHFPARAYVDGALARAKHPRYVEAADRPYKSKNLLYITTEFKFP